MGCFQSREEKRQEHWQGGHGSGGIADGHYQSHSAPPRSNLGEQQGQYQQQKPSSEFLRPKPVHGQDTILGNPFEDVRMSYTLGKELGRGQFGVTYKCAEVLYAT